VAVVEDEINIDFHYSKKLYSEAYNTHLSGEAHSMYLEALDLYHRARKMMLHTLCKEGIVREQRLLEIVSHIQHGEGILLAAGIINRRESKSLKKFWVGHEIKQLVKKFARLRIKAVKLPNLAFAEHAYHFVIDEAKLVVKAAVAVPGIVIGTLKEAASAVHHCLSHIKAQIGWAIEEAEEELIYIGHKIHDIGHNIKAEIKYKWEHFKGKFHKCHHDDSCNVCYENDSSCPANSHVIFTEEDTSVAFKLTRKQAEAEVTTCVKELKADEEAMAYELHATEKEVLAARWEDDNAEPETA
jgi:hypothetical protein